MDNKLIDNLAGKLEGIMNFVEESAKATGDFAKEQIPLYIQELLSWAFWESFAWTFLFAAIAGFLWWLRAFIIKKSTDKDGDVSFDTYWGTLVITLVLSVPCLCGVVNNGLQTLKVGVAPRVWLVEYVAKAINKSK